MLTILPLLSSRTSLLKDVTSAYQIYAYYFIHFLDDFANRKILVLSKR